MLKMYIKGNTMLATLMRPVKAKVKGILAWVHQKRRNQELMTSKPHITSSQIAKDLRAMGVELGDVLFVHSSLKSLGYVEGGPIDVIKGLLDAVGPQGTLILPTYYMPGGSILGTCQLEGYVFDPRVQGTNMGALPEAFLQFPGAQRSIHPTHSVSAIGKHAKYLTEAHHLASSVFGVGSPWERFYKLNGKVLGIGISLGPVTFYHFLEDTMGDRFPINVWINEVYQLPCKGWNGEDFQVPVRPYRLELPPVRIDHKSREDLRGFMWSEMEKNHVLHIGKVGSARSWFVQAHAFFQQIERLATEGITIYTPPDALPQAGLTQDLRSTNSETSA